MELIRQMRPLLVQYCEFNEGVQDSFGTALLAYCRVPSLFFDKNIQVDRILHRERRVLKRSVS